MGFGQSSPEHLYKNQGWYGYPDWLGKGRVASNKRNYLNYQDAVSYIQSLKLKSTDEWLQYCKSKDLPSNIPRKPDRVYKQDWKGMSAWLSNGRLSAKDRKYLDFNDAKKFVNSLKLKNTDVIEIVHFIGGG